MKKRPNPEWTDEVIAQARPAHEVLPPLFGEALAQEMLRPMPLAPAQQPDACDLSNEVIEHFRAKRPKP